MNERDILHRLACLEQQNRRLGQWIKRLVCAWMITIPSLIAGWTLPARKVTLLTAPADTLCLRKLVIADEKGNERIVIAAPLPDPIIDGKIFHRRDVVTAGVQFKDPNGNERGGIAAHADGSLMFGIDDETGRERAHIYYLPKRGCGVYLQGEKGTETIDLLIPPGGNPKLDMTDQSGKKTVAIPSQK